MAIGQVNYQLGIAIFDVDGVTKLYDNNNEALSSGLVPPTFPDVGDEVTFVLNGQSMVCTLASKRSTYFVGDGVSISTLVTVTAIKR